MTDFAELVVGVDSSGVDRGRESMVRFGNTSEQTEQKTKRATDRMSENFERSGSRVASALGRVTGQLVALGAAAVSIGSAGRTLAQFESSMSRVQAITGATDQTLQSLRSTAQTLGSTTSFSATQAADALTFLGMAGFEASEAMEALPAVLDLAEAAGMGLAQTADIASNVLSGFGMEASSAATVADVLAAASTSANTSVSQLGRAMSTVAPISASLGISLEETAAAIGVMSDAGIQGERAGTALRGVLASLANPTSQAAEALRSYGLTVGEVNPETEGLATVMDRLGAVGLSTADAMTIFGREAASGALVLVDGSDRVESFTDELRRAEGAASDMASTMRDNLRGDITGLISSVEGLVLALGDAGLTSVLRGAVQGATAFARAITTMVSAIADGADASTRFLRSITGLESTQDILQRAIDNSTLAMGDQIRQVQLLSSATEQNNVVSLEAARVRLAQAEADRQALQSQRDLARQEFFELQGLPGLLAEADRRRAELDEILSAPARANDLGIDLPGLTQDTASWSAEIENAERLLADTLSEIEAIRQSARDLEFLNPDDTARMAELEELARQLGVGIENAQGEVVNLNGEVVQAIDLSARLSDAAASISFESATASALALSRQLGVSLEIANQLDATLDRQAGIDRGGVQPVTLGGDSFRSPDVGIGPGLGTMLGEELSLSGDTTSQYEALVQSLDRVSVAASGASSSTSQLSDVTQRTNQILGRISKEAVTYADVVNELRQRLQEGTITQEEFNDAVARAEDEFSKAGQGGTSAFGRMGSTISSAIREADNLADAISRIADRLVDLALDQSISGLFGLLGSGGSGGGLLGGLFSFLFNSKGNAFQAGTVTPFALGGVVNGPTMFGMPNGLGMMGEAGPEGILPLERGPDGSLGVKAYGGNMAGVDSLLSLAGGFSLASSQIDGFAASIHDMINGLGRDLFVGARQFRDGMSGLSPNDVMPKPQNSQINGPGNSLTGQGPVEFRVINNVPNTEVTPSQRQGPDGRELFVAEFNKVVASGDADRSLGSRFGSRQPRVLR